LNKIISSGDSDNKWNGLQDFKLYNYYLQGNSMGKLQDLWNDEGEAKRIPVRLEIVMGEHVDVEIG